MKEPKTREHAITMELMRRMKKVAHYCKYKRQKWPI